MEGLGPVSSTHTEINHVHISPKTSYCWGRLFQILTAPFVCCKKKSHVDHEAPHPQNHVHWADQQNGLEEDSDVDPEIQQLRSPSETNGIRLRSGYVLVKPYNPSDYM